MALHGGDTTIAGAVQVEADGDNGRADDYVADLSPQHRRPGIDATKLVGNRCILPWTGWHRGRGSVWWSFRR